MNWDSIEVKWSEMARRAAGDAGRCDVVDNPGNGPARAQSDAGPADAKADRVALETAGPADRAIA